jgi:hypothetical protein
MLKRLTIQRVTVVILFALIFAMAVRVPLDTDTWWHIESGEYIIENRSVPKTDPFSHTRGGEPWIDHSWGAQIIIYLTYELAGNAGLAIYTALLAAAGMGFVYHSCRGSGYVKAFALVLGAAAAAVFWSARPQMISFFLSTVVAYLLYRFKRRGEMRALYAIPPVMLLWANLHGGFAIGFILMFGYLAGEVIGRLLNPGDPDVAGWDGIKRLALAIVLSLVAICINPNGVTMLTYPFRTVGIGALQDFIQEWASPNFHERQTWPFVFLLLGVLAAAGLSRKRIDWTDLALVSGTAFMSLMAGRNIATFAVVASPVLIRHADDWLDERGWNIEPSRRARGVQGYVNLLLLVLIVLGAGLKVVGVVLPETVDVAQEERLPVRVAGWMNANKDRLEGLKMFNSYNWGGYLMFAAPDFPVFVDGRTDLYDDEFLREFLSAWRGFPGWEETLRDYDIGFVVVEAGGLMANAMRPDGDWVIVYEDEQAIVFVSGEVYTSRDW